MPKREHVQIWRPGVGWHGYIAPDKATIAMRMRARFRAAGRIGPQVTSEMVNTFVAAGDIYLDDGDIAAGLDAVLAMVDEVHAVEMAKLRGAIRLAQQSRNVWVKRAMDAGWKP
ncbi:hypothetical protein [Actinoplanes palleronii]|nr:hypothetical protein [Actinoplanes palleronii]